MAIELNPTAQSVVKLTNDRWVFITNMLRNTPYGAFVDAGCANLLDQINIQVISQNQPAPAVPKAEPAEVSDAPAGY